MSNDLTNENSEIANLIATARMGFNVVPICTHHNEKGMGMLHMNGEGLKFESFDESDPIIISWADFDRGPLSKHSAEERV